MMQLSDSDFERMVRFMQDNYGINLTKKRQLINNRLSLSLITQGYENFTQFVDKLISKRDDELIDLVLSKLTTNYTYFMREKEHYDFFMNVVLPDISKKNQNKKVLSIWSAGCSTGEEPYNLSMCLKEYFGANASQWDTRVLATDISPRVLAQARNPSYEMPNDIPPAWKTKYFMKRNDGSGLYTVTPEIRKNVIFRTFNLMDPIKFKLDFDVIFCRNVMIYFDQPTKDALVKRFYNATKKGGYLMIGHSENLSKDCPYKMIRPATFQKR